MWKASPSPGDSKRFKTMSSIRGVSLRMIMTANGHGERPAALSRSARPCCSAARHTRRALSVAFTEESQNVSVGVAQMRKDTAPRLLLRRGDEVDAARRQGLVRGEDVGNLKGDADKAS